MLLSLSSIEPSKLSNTSSSNVSSSNSQCRLRYCLLLTKTGKIKIPKEYFNEYNKKQKLSIPVQIQFLVRMNYKELKELPIEFTTKNILTKTKFFNRNGIRTEMNFTISKGLKKDDLKIYINGYKTKINKEYYSYNSKTGNLTINYNPIAINKIEVKENTIIKKILGYNKVSALAEDYFLGPKSPKVVPTFEVKAVTSIPKNGYVDMPVYGYNHVENTWSSTYVYRNKTVPRGNIYVDWGSTINLTESSFGTNNVDYVVGVPLKTIGYTPKSRAWYDSTEVIGYYEGSSKIAYVYGGCVHTSLAWGGTNMHGADVWGNTEFYYKKVDESKSGDWVTVTYIALENPEKTYESITGDGSAGQSLAIIWKVTYEDTKYGTIEVQKKLQGATENATNLKGFNFRLYTDSKCTKKADYSEATTNASGVASFGSKIPLGTYYIHETKNKTNFEDITNCTKVTLSESTKKNSKYYVIKNYTNRREYYATKVYKYSNDPECSGYVNGAKFTLHYGGSAQKGKNGSGNLEATTGGNPVVVHDGYDDNRRQWFGSCAKENGMAIYAMLGGPAEDKHWQVKETTVTDITKPYNATVQCGNTTRTLKMWSTGSNGLFPSNSTLETKKMTYSGGKYYCPTSGWTGANALANKNKKANTPVYYCFKVVKVDSSTNKKITADTAKFKATLGSKTYTADTVNGVATFLVNKNPGTYTVQETKAPKGYSLPTTKVTVAAVEMKKDSNGKNASDCTVAIPNDPVTAKSGTGWVKMDDSRLVLNWYKVRQKNNSELLNGAKFKVKVKGTNNYVKVKATQEKTIAKNGTYKTCYVYDGTSSSGTELVSYNTKTNNKNTNGEVCISGVEKGTYVIEETTPAQYHAFGSVTSIEQSTSENFYTKIVTSSTSSQINTFLNCDTEFELTKKVTNDHSTDPNDPQYKQTTKELKKLLFNIYYIDSNNQEKLVTFTKTSDGNYEYAKGVMNGTNALVRNANGNVTDLSLNDNRKLNIKNLPWQYKYKIKEKATTGCKDINQNPCETQGFYLVKDSDSPDWIINTKSSTCTPGSTGKVTRDVTNTVTEINFSKEDIYSYLDGNTNSEVESKYENDQEYKLFDTIDFILKHKNANGTETRLKLEKVRDVGTCTLASANNKTAYAEYRYVIDNGQSNQKEIIHTYCGNIKIKHLCRDTDYYIEEISVPNESVFILPTPHPEVKFTVGTTNDTFTRDSETHVIDNTPTRVVFQKRDLKYGNIINETVGREKTTFNLYRCNEGISPEQCTPTTGTLIKFHPRAVIKDKQDNEDYGKEIYRYGESQSASGLITDLHPYKGDLIIRYLPGGKFKTKENGEREYVAYNYILVETQAPTGYDTPTNGNEITRFKVNTETVAVDVVNIANKPTKLILRKYDQATGELITGAKFKIYKVANYDQNRALRNQDMTLLKLKTIRDGEYEYRDNKDTNVITTCIKDCNLITSDLVTDDFKTTGLGTEELKTEIKEGEALIQYLEAENYYVVEEVSPREGYSLPSEDDRFTLVYIPKTTGEADASVELYNTETVYQFYKFDEYNNLIDGAEFKLQKLDDNKKYNDVTVELDQERTENTENAIVYKVNDEVDNTTITTKNGSAMIYRLTEGQYRILETKAPEGKQLPKKTINVATFFVDKDGHVYGSAIITNKTATGITSYNPAANAELIVNIQTGQNRIKYGLIIAAIVLAVSALIYFQNKKK